MTSLLRSPFRLLLALALVVGLLPTAAFAQDKPADIVDTAVAAGNFSTLVAAVQAAGLVDTLKGDGPFTVFAPTDEAFAKLPAGTVDALLADPEGALKQILLYHVVSGKVLSSDLSDGLEAPTVQGENVKFTLADGKAMVNDANIIAADIEAGNGVIHVIDSVILPPSLAAASAEATPEATAEATAEATPEATVEAAAEAAPVTDIVDTAVAAGSFKTLVAAVQAAGLVDALKGEGPFTVFAPTDEAFAKLPAGTVDALLADPKGDLTQILLYHVLSGKVLAADVKDGLEATTLQGKPVKFSIKDGKAYINDAQIVTTDIPTSNGVIHVIDSVILPPADEAAAAEAAPAEAAPAAEAAAASAPAADQAPDTMPVTGGETSPVLPLAVAGLALAALAGAAFVTSKRAA
jgi:transforming growth factor-beta-induced protein